MVGSARSGDPKNMGERVGPSQWPDLLRAAARVIFLSWYALGCVIFAVCLSCIVPWGQHNLLQYLVVIHGALVGFTLTVLSLSLFGATGEYIQRLVPGASAKAMRGCPLALDACCVILCVVRMSHVTDWAAHPALALSWRFLYVFLAARSLLVTYKNIQFLFLFAMWRFEELFERSRADRDSD